ncbi:DUF1932 domain-containing protein [Amycolatopsis sp. NPDC059021]|uniref:NAD(P)-dependent oxidoreductase n=1 Tax=Amycolatopsis sp. NPDC059021 TaxID=3346704 RepID=UPI003671A6A9
MNATEDTVALLHPGDMGAAVGKQLVDKGIRTTWIAGGRGAATQARAEAAGLEAREEPRELADCSVVISVCPPAAALDVAASVAATGFRGVYLDANAISPEHAREIDALFARRGGVSVVDGGIVGPPPREAGTTRLYLSGADSAVVRDLFEGTTLRPIVLGAEVGGASALKLSFAAYNKMTHALAALSYSVAGHHGVTGELRELAATMLPGTPLGTPDALLAAGRRAWRWEGEMAEIASACEDSGAPGLLPRAAEDLFAHWASCKDDDTLTFERLLRELTRSDEG